MLTVVCGAAPSSRATTAEAVAEPVVVLSLLGVARGGPDPLGEVPEVVSQAEKGSAPAAAAPTVVV